MKQHLSGFRLLMLGFADPGQSRPAWTTQTAPDGRTKAFPFIFGPQGSCIFFQGIGFAQLTLGFW